MQALEKNYRLLVIAHLSATLFMVGLIWTIHYVHYPLFAKVGEQTYVDFQTAHVERIGKLLLLPWLTEGVTLIAILALAFLGTHKALRIPTLINGAAMAVVLVISGFWSAPAHGKLADGFDKAVHDQLMTANLIRTLAWSVCGICAIWIALSTSNSKNS
ncbi:MAG: hypothetical protein EBR53_07875 [Actinobacteria bacterium]|nr:hypothetical protein [Actinomycetota bacterium]